MENTSTVSRVRPLKRQVDNSSHIIIRHMRWMMYQQQQQQQHRGGEIHVKSDLLQSEETVWRDSHVKRNEWRMGASRFKVSISR